MASGWHQDDINRRSRLADGRSDERAWISGSGSPESSEELEETRLGAARVSGAGGEDRQSRWVHGESFGFEMSR